MKTLRWLLPYILCAACLVTIYVSVAHLLPGRAWFGFYYCLSLWSLMGTEGYLALRRKLRIKSSWAVEDRLLSYLVTAPFIWPVRLFQLLTSQSTATPIK